MTVESISKNIHEGGVDENMIVAKTPDVYAIFSPRFGIFTSSNK